METRGTPWIPRLIEGSSLSRAERADPSIAKYAVVGSLLVAIVLQYYNVMILGEKAQIQSFLQFRKCPKFETSCRLGIYKKKVQYLPGFVEISRFYTPQYPAIPMKLILLRERWC